MMANRDQLLELGATLYKVYKVSSYEKITYINNILKIMGHGTFSSILESQSFLLNLIKLYQFLFISWHNILTVHYDKE